MRYLRLASIESGARAEIIAATRPADFETQGAKHHILRFRISRPANGCILIKIRLELTSRSVSPPPAGGPGAH
jgi:hypothetical protein